MYFIDRSTTNDFYDITPRHTSQTFLIVPVHYGAPELRDQLRVICPVWFKNSNRAVSMCRHYDAQGTIVCTVLLGVIDRPVWVI